jgi:hypothetical protein
MIPKSGNRFSEKIMLHQDLEASALITPNDILGRYGPEFALFSSETRLKLPLQPVPRLVAGLQIATDQGTNIFAGVFLKAVLANLLLQVGLELTADADMNAVICGHQPILCFIFRIMEASPILSISATLAVFVLGSRAGERLVPGVPAATHDR